MYRRFRYRLKSYRFIRDLVCLTCCLLMFVQYLSVKLFYWEETPSPILSRLNPDRPLLFDLQSYSVCHPEELHVKNMTADFHQYAKKDVCFLIEHLDGGPWWSYVSQEFAEILTELKELGIDSKVNYRSFSPQLNVSSIQNLTDTFLHSCGLDENVYRQKRTPIILLLWDINRFLWHEKSAQWNSLSKILPLRVLVFIDDLHYTTQEIFHSRQYLFEHITSEIFSTYAYLFHNYYTNISSTKITWLPHAASSFSSRTVNQSAQNVLFISGARTFEWYPCRARGFLLCKERKDLAACLKHPGYGETMKNDSRYFYGAKRYYSYMRQYTFGLGTCQSVHYAIAKLFELPANGLLLITTDDLIPVLRRLHLNHNEHFLTVQCSSVNQLASEVLNLRKLPQERINEIRVRSQKIIHRRHKTKHRAALLHVRLLAQALLATSSSESERQKWESWGRNCA